MSDQNIHVDWDVSLDAGDQLGDSFTLDDGTNPIDVSGWTVQYILKKSPSGPDSGALIDYNSTDDADEVAKSDSGTGTVDTITVTFDSTDATALTAGKYFHRLIRTAGGARWTFAKGYLTVEDN